MAHKRKKRATAGNDPLSVLLGSHARVRLLRLFLFNQKNSFTGDSIVTRVQISSAEVRQELQLLVTAGIIRRSGALQPRYSLDERFPYIQQLQEIFLDSSLRGNDIYERVRRAGNIKCVILAGVFVGDYSGRLDVLIVGDRLSDRRLKTAMKNLDADIGKELRYASFSAADFAYRLTISDRFIRDVFDYPHRVVVDKLGLRFPR